MIGARGRSASFSRAEREASRSVDLPRRGSPRTTRRGWKVRRRTSSAAEARRCVGAAELEGVGLLDFEHGLPREEAEVVAGQVAGSALRRSRGCTPSRRMTSGTRSICVDGAKLQATEGRLQRSGAAGDQRRDRACAASSARRRSSGSGRRGWQRLLERRGGDWRREDLMLDALLIGAGDLRQLSWLVGP